MFDSMFPSHWTTLRKLMWLKLKGASAVWDTISGNPVSFSAKAAPLRQLKVAFSPVQSLNGYDAPWPAGGGKNKLEVTATTDTINGVTFTVNSDGTITTSGTASANAFFTVGNATFINDSPSGTYILSGCPANGGNPYNMDVQGASGADNGEGRTITFTGESINTNVRIRIYSGTNATGLVFKPMICLATAPNPDYAHFAPYSNLCPISGWSSVGVEQRGKNLLNLARTSVITSPHSSRDFAENQVWVGLSFNNYFNSSRISDYEITGGGITVECNSVAYGVAFPISCKPNTAYIVSWESESASAAVAIGYYKKDGTYISSSPQSPPNVRTVTTPNECEWFTVCFAPNAQSVAVSYSNIQLELGSPASDYQPYNPSSSSISISLGSTVYSGYVDVVTGVGGDASSPFVVNGDTNISAGGDAYEGQIATARYCRPSFSIGDVGGQVAFANCFSDTFKGTSDGIWNSPDTHVWNCTIYGRRDVYMVFDNATVGITTDMDKATRTAKIKAWLADNPITFVLPLATHIPIQLTPTEVQSLAGDNVLFSDANGDLTVIYRSN